MSFRKSGHDKERYVEALFSSIAPKYDLLNSVMSLNRHKQWRKFAVSRSGIGAGGAALDVATGTGDFAIELAHAAGNSGSVIATDFCEPMVQLGHEKTESLGLDNIHFALANAEKLPFPDNTFDCATIGFALRNVASVPSTIAEMTRVVKPGGKVVSLEISKPRLWFIKPFWRAYFYGLVPSIARIFKAKKEPYEYLPDSVKRFCSREELADIMRQAGLEQIEIIDLTMGVVCVHVGVKGNT